MYLILTLTYGYIWFLLQDFKNISRYRINYHKNINFYYIHVLIIYKKSPHTKEMKALYFVLICSHVKFNNIQSLPTKYVLGHVRKRSSGTLGGKIGRGVTAPNASKIKIFHVLADSSSTYHIEFSIIFKNSVCW